MTASTICTLAPAFLAASAMLLRRMFRKMSSNVAMATPIFCALASGATSAAAVGTAISSGFIRWVSSGSRTGLAGRNAGLLFVCCCFVARAGGRAGGQVGAPMGAAAGSVFAGVPGHVLGRDQLERDADEALLVLLPGQFDRRIDRACALPDGVLENRDLQVAGLHRRQRIGRGIDAGNDGLGRPLLGGLERVDRAEGHLVVVRDDGVELQPRTEPVGGDVLAPGAVPLALALVGNLDARAFLARQHIL